MKKTILALLISSVSLPLFAQDSGQKIQSPTNISYSTNDGEQRKAYVMRISHVVNANTPKGKASIKFKEMLEARFPGRIKVEIYHDNSLFKDREETEALDIGAVEAIIPTLGKVASGYGVKEFELFDLPFLFNSNEEVDKFVKSNAGNKLLEMFNSKNKNIAALTLWPNDFRIMSGQKPFKTPADFKGLSVRVEASGTMKYTYDTLGVAKTITIPFGELKKALQDGINKTGENRVDAAENPLSNFWSAKLYENQPWITMSNHDYIGYTFLVNKKWLNNLPEDLRNGVVESAREAGTYHMEVAQKDNETILKDLESKGVKFYKWTKEEKDLFKKAAIPVHANFMKNINKNYLLEVYQVVRQQ